MNPKDKSPLSDAYKDAISSIAQSEKPSHDKLLNKLQEELNNERDARREERFMWIVSLVILFDVVVFPIMSTFTGPLIIATFQILILLSIARRMGMQEIVKMMENILVIGAKRAKDFDET